MTHHDRLRDADPMPQRHVEALSLEGADTILLEEIMTTHPPGASRRWLPVFAAAAAVAVIGVGAVSLGTGAGPADGSRQPSGVAGAPSATQPPSGTPRGDAAVRQEARETCEGGFVITVVGGAATGYDCLDTSDRPEPAGQYQRPLRPFLLTAPGWELEQVDGTGIRWRGPDGARLRTDWVVSANPADPFADDRYQRRGEAIEVLGLTTRLTGFLDAGRDVQVALTPQVPGQRYDDRASLVFESSDLDPVAFREVVESARFVSLAEFEAAAGR